MWMIKAAAKMLMGVLVLPGLVVVILCLVISRSMVQSAEGKLLSETAIPGEYDAVLVLGAGVYADGSPTPMLAYRIDTGISLQQQGAAPLLLMSGDSEKPGYDETGPMVLRAKEAGVPESAILRDAYGLCTYDSLWRAKEVYGMKRLVVVTQRYHLYRTLYYTQALGIEAVGVPAPDRMDVGQIYRELREILARVKAVIWCQKLPNSTYTE